MGISIFQLLVVAVIIAAVFVSSRRFHAVSDTVSEQIVFSKRLIHWVVVSLAATGSVFLFRFYYEFNEVSLLINSFLAIIAYETVRHFEKTNAALSAFFVVIPIVAALDYFAGGFVYIYVTNPYDFNETFNEFSAYAGSMPDPMYVLTVLLNAAILAGVSSILLRFQVSDYQTITNNQYVTSVSYGGLAVNDRQNEANRYAMSYALLGGSSFRKDVINRAKDKHNAVTNELGLDLTALLKSCLYFEAREKKFRGVFVALAILFLIGAVQESEILVTFSLFAMIITQLVKSFQERFSYVPEFRNREFDAQNFLNRYKVNYKVEEYPGLTEATEKNVSIYKGYVPFEGAGLEMGGWSFSVDLSRPKDSLGTKSKPESFGIFEIYGALENAILKLGIPNLSIEDHFFVNGADIAGFNDLLPDKFAKPCQRFDDKLKATYQSKTDGLMRHYKWIQIKDWGSDLINSFFVRYEMRGENLFLEASKYLLTPIDARYRKLDRVLPFTFMNNVVWFAGSVVKTVFTLVGSLVFAYIDVMGVITEALGFPERAKRKHIRNSIHYNYGAPVSIRQKLSSPNFMHYYQKMDNEMYLKTLERQIIDATVDFLEAHNIDVSEIKERGSTILNSGVFVQGGDVKAQTLAVGKGAKAETKGILSKVKRSPATA